MINICDRKSKFSIGSEFSDSLVEIFPDIIYREAVHNRKEALALAHQGLQIVKKKGGKDYDRLYNFFVRAIIAMEDGQILYGIEDTETMFLVDSIENFSPSCRRMTCDDLVSGYCLIETNDPEKHRLALIISENTGPDDIDSYEPLEDQQGYLNYFVLDQSYYFDRYEAPPEPLKFEVMWDTTWKRSIMLTYSSEPDYPGALYETSFGYTHAQYLENYLQTVLIRPLDEDRSESKSKGVSYSYNPDGPPHKRVWDDFEVEVK